MKQTLMVKLDPTPEQSASLLQTMERFNEAANWVAGIAVERHTASKYLLQKLIYHDVRERFGLSAQMTVRCINKVSDVYKRDKKIRPTFKSHGAVIYDDRILRFKGLTSVSILTLAGRMDIALRLGEYQVARLDRRHGQADLLYRQGAFYLAVTINAPEETPIDPVGALGVDLGIVHLATDSDGNAYSGAAVERNRRIHAHQRRNLQRRQTKSATRKLKRIAGRQSRFQRDTNHCISKALVRHARDTGRLIGLEDLTGIGDRITVRRRHRARHANWAFCQLRSFIDYKARCAGVPVVMVDPRNTSRTCSQCGYCDKANRKSQALFLCGSCGYGASADHNAALNLSARAAVMQPNGSNPKASESQTPGASHLLQKVAHDR